MLRKRDLPLPEANLSQGVKRAVAAGGTVVVGAAVNVTTGVLTQHWAAGWWAATVVVVVGGVGLQVWLTFTERPAPKLTVLASGDGAIAGAGPITNSSTRVSRPGGAAPWHRQESLDAHGDGQICSTGLGSIASGAAIDGAHTDVSDGGQSAQ